MSERERLLRAARAQQAGYTARMIIKWIVLLAILGIVIAILALMVSRFNAVDDCLTIIKSTTNTILSTVNSIQTSVTSILTVINTTVLTNLNYLITKADAGMLMVDEACDDGNVCTVDLCDTFGGCVHRPGKAALECHDYCRDDPILVKKTIRSQGRSVIPNGACARGTCVSSEPCKGDCPSGSTAQCPTLAFKNDTACTLDCTASLMCVWHCSINVDAPWVPSTGLATDNVWLEGDSRIDLECMQFLNATDALTGLIMQGSCLVVNSQIYRTTPAKKDELAERNVISVWNAVCQYHFACSTAEPVPIIPVI